MTTLIVRTTDTCPCTNLFANRCIPSNERSPWANVNSPHDYGNHEKLEGKELPTVNPSQKPQWRRATLSPLQRTHGTAKVIFACIEFEDVRDEAHDKKNNVDVVVHLLVCCIHKLTIKTLRHSYSGVTARMHTAENSILGSQCNPSRHTTGTLPKLSDGHSITVYCIQNGQNGQNILNILNPIREVVTHTSTGITPNTNMESKEDISMVKCTALRMG